MDSNMNFYNFMHKQLLVLIALFAGTGISYIYIGFLYGSLLPEILWYLSIVTVSVWGFRLHKHYKDYDLSLQEKSKWLDELRYFLFSYFSLWTIIFLLYTSRANIELHYISLVTQFGAAVVASTILVSQRILTIATVVSLMLPIFAYYIMVGEFYSYLLAFFTFVLTGVLLYAANNTYNYLVKSQFQAYHDYLTNLGNRRYFIELLENSIKIQKQNGIYLYLLLIDLDHFKTINDTLGHDIGDELLIEVSSRMSKVGDEYECTVSRLGGDEFCLLSGFYDNKEACHNSALKASEALLTAIKESYIINEHHLYISASIGLSTIDNPNIKASNFIKEADIAMYEAKAKGRDGVIVFTQEMAKFIEYKLDIERHLHFALEKDEISLRYQPQINLKTKTIGCEVLVRWHSEDLGHLPPDIFIPISEQIGIIIELGFYILEESFKTLQDWDNRGVKIDQMSINISTRQLFYNNFANDVVTLAQKYLREDLYSKLMFEITETSVAEDIGLMIEKIKPLSNLGIKFSMDDFGTGYSSLSYLRELSLDELKIDKSFIDELETTSEGKSMVKTILSFARNLNMSVVAEGVEEAAQVEFLKEIGCDVLQGYYFSKPILKEEFELFIENQNIEVIRA
jgi:diguanylate cyclase